MTTALATTSPAGASLAEISAETMEALVVGGDLSKLNPKQRLEVYVGKCAAAGLDPRTQPFSYLNLQGKLTLYATKTATDQLIAVHRLNVEVLERKIHAELGVIEVVVKVTFPDGHAVSDVGVVSLPAGLKGDAAANAIMKAVTKAKRRTVLSACGLGMLDETETETIQGAYTVPVNPTTGEITSLSHVKPGEPIPNGTTRAALEAAAPKFVETPAPAPAAVTNEPVDAEFEEVPAAPPATHAPHGPGSAPMADKASDAQIKKISVMYRKLFGDFEKDPVTREAVVEHMKRHTGKASRTMLTKREASSLIETLMAEEEAERIAKEAGLAETAPAAEGPVDGDVF